MDDMMHDVMMMDKRKRNKQIYYGSYPGPLHYPSCIDIPTGVQVAVTPATPQLANEYKMYSPRPIKVKYHVVDVHMTPLEE
jgi:hypothetical protein